LTTADRAVIDVALNARPDTLRSPAHAITDGSPNPTMVRAWLLTARLQRIPVPLSVDTATARRIARFHRALWIYVPFIFPAGVLSLAVVAIATAIPPYHPIRTLVLISLIPALGGFLVLAPLALMALRPTQYPRRQSGGGIIIARANRAAADEWAAANPPGTVTVVPRYR
jgi:hypothetical protein